MGLLDYFETPKVANKLLGLLREKAPEVYGSIGGLLGTAPDQFEGSVLDPMTARVRSGAEAGFPVGTALQIAPLVGNLLSRAASMPHSAGMGQRGILDLDLFHGTQRVPDGISEFGAGKTYWGAKANKNNGLWMTSSPDKASDYANWVKGSGNPTVYPIKAQFKNPASLDDLERLGIHGDPEMVLYEAKNLAKLKRAGFDGVVWDARTYTGQTIPDSENAITALSLYPQRMKSKFAQEAVASSASKVKR